MNESSTPRPATSADHLFWRFVIELGSEFPFKISVMEGVDTTGYSAQQIERHMANINDLKRIRQELSDMEGR